MTDLERLASEQAPFVAAELSAAADLGGNEAEFRHRVARILEDCGTKCSVRITARDEFSVARGRVDSVYNRLVLEYKRPGILRDKNTHRGNREIIQQVKDYILDVAKREKRESHRSAASYSSKPMFIPCYVCPPAC